MSEEKVMYEVDPETSTTINDENSCKQDEYNVFESFEEVYIRKIPETMYFTVVATDFYHGSDFLKRGDNVTLTKEPDNKHDKEAIKVSIEGLGQIGYVANSPHTVKGDALSAGRLYDKFDDNIEGEVMYVFDSGAFCKIK